MNLQIVSLVDCCVPANAKGLRDMSTRAVSDSGDRSRMAAEIIGSVQHAGSNTG